MNNKKFLLLQFVTLVLSIVAIISSHRTEKINAPTTSARGITPINILLSIPPSMTQKSSTMAVVVDVVDGDTIKVSIDGIQKTVRYIGIDTPETVDPRRPVGCFGIEAKEKNIQLVQNQTVTLEKDVSETDKYGRLLRYVYVGDTLINQLLVSEGFAHASAYPPDVKYQKQLNNAEDHARAQAKGLWSSCSVASPSPTPYMNLNSCQYSCNGPDRDCSDFLSQTDAQKFFTCCGFTPENDPMNLDNVGIGDGIACGK